MIRCKCISPKTVQKRIKYNSFVKKISKNKILKRSFGWDNKPAQNLSLDFAACSCAVVITTKSQRHKILKKVIEEGTICYPAQVSMFTINLNSCTVKRYYTKLMMKMVNCFLQSRHLILFPAGIIAMHSNHDKLPTRRKQDLNLPRTWVEHLLIEVAQ